MYKFYTNHYVSRMLPALLLLALAPASALAGFRFDPEDCVYAPPSSGFHSSALETFNEVLPGKFWHQAHRLETLISQLSTLDLDGLEPSDYYPETLAQIQDHLSTWGSLNPCDVRLINHVYLMALSDLRFGRLATQGHEQLWYSPCLANATPSELIELAGGDVAAAFTGARPNLDRYVRLRAAYQKARTELPERWPAVAPGATLAEGDQSERVRSLRDRLRAEGFVPTDNADTSNGDRFTTDVAEAVRAFQRRHYLEADGKVGQATLDQLNIQPATRLEQVRTNLERLRWLAADMEEKMLLVDIAAARIEFYRDGEITWTTRAQVGRPLRETPQLKSLITHVTVNPTWTIPTSIFLKDQLPKIQNNPYYLSERNIRIFDRSGTEVSASEVDWRNPRGLLLRQDPGNNNALGEVVIRFSNPYAVYLHDTPSSWLFNTPNRFYSSGCVRVEDAMQLTSLLFEGGPPSAWQELQAQRATGETRNVHLPRSVPVLLAYWTAEADAEGNLLYRPDTYEDDQQLITGLSQRDGTSKL